MVDGSKKCPAAGSKTYYLPVHYIKFICLSSLGASLFLYPVFTDTGISISVAELAKMLIDQLGERLKPILLSVFFISLVVSLGVQALASNVSSEKLPSFLRMFQCHVVWLVVRCLGIGFLICCYFGIGPLQIIDERTGSMVFESLLPALFGVFIFASFFLPLLTNFGLMEFLGVLASKVMRPLFKLPGRSAVNCIASWVGDGTVGVMLTAKQYELGHYTQREACIIATNFPAVSISSCLIILTQAGLTQYFPLFYFTACLCGVVCALILCRIPPLSLKQREYVDGSVISREVIRCESNLFKHAVAAGLTKASTTKLKDAWLGQGLLTMGEMLFCILPIVMFIGTLALIVSYYTPCFDWLGMPFVYVLEWFHIPDASTGAKAIMPGLADAFIPSLIVQSSQYELTRFVIATLSVCQLLFLAETGAVILASKMPISVFELLAVFILRTLICLPVIVLVGHCFF